MKKILLLLAIFSLQFSIFNPSSAQLSFSHAFSLGNTYNDRGTKMAADALGNYYCIGHYNYWININPLGTPNYLTSNGGQDFYVAKYSPSGILTWALTFGGSGDDDALNIRLDDNANLYITGRFRDTVDFEPDAGNDDRISNGGNDIFLVKLDSAGGYYWVISMGGTGDDQATGIAFTSSFSNIVLCGSFDSDSVDFNPGAGTHFVTGSPAGNAFLASYNFSNGNYNWSFGLGGAGGADAWQVVTNNTSGYFYVTGSFAGTNVDFDPGNGTELLSSQGSVDIFIAKYSGSGAYQWAYGIGGPGGDIGFTIACDQAGYVYAGGYFNSAIVDFDPGAGTTNLTTNGVQDLFVTKYKSDGTFLWAFSAGGLNSEVAQDIAVDATGNIFVTGSWGNTVDFDPGPGTHTLTGSPNIEAYLAVYDSSGSFMDAIPIGGDGYEFGIGVCVIAPNKIGVTGFMSTDSIDFDPAGGTHYLYNTGGNPIYEDAFVATYQYLPTEISDFENIKQFSVFPNPVSSVLRVRSREMITELVCFDLMGQEVFRSTVNNRQTSVDVSQFESGIYFVQVRFGNKTSTQKVVVQH